MFYRNDEVGLVTAVERRPACFPLRPCHGPCRWMDPDLFTATKQGWGGHARWWASTGGAHVSGDGVPGTCSHSVSFCVEHSTSLSLKTRRFLPSSLPSFLPPSFLPSSSLPPSLPSSLPSFLPSFFPSFFLFLASTTSSHFTNSRRGPPVFWIQSLPLVSGWGVLPTAPLNGGIWFQTQPLLIFFPFAS